MIQDSSLPCEVDARAGENADSELCSQVVTEYCLSFPADEDCDFVVPYFQRTTMGLLM